MFGIVAATQSSHSFRFQKVRRIMTSLRTIRFPFLYLIHHTIMYGIWLMSPGRGLLAFISALAMSPFMLTRPRGMTIRDVKPFMIDGLKHAIELAVQP